MGMIKIDGNCITLDIPYNPKVFDKLVKYNINVDNNLYYIYNADKDKIKTLLRKVYDWNELSTINDVTLIPKHILNSSKDYYIGGTYVTNKEDSKEFIEYIEVKISSSQMHLINKDDFYIGEINGI